MEEKSICELTTEELAKLYKAVELELCERRGRAERECWQKVVDAIHEYISNYGNICLEIPDDTFSLDGNANMVNTGTIEIY